VFKINVLNDSTAIDPVAITRANSDSSLYSALEIDELHQKFTRLLLGSQAHTAPSFEEVAVVTGSTFRLLVVVTTETFWVTACGHQTE
jgi:hypothetical protein